MPMERKSLLLAYIKFVRISIDSQRPVGDTSTFEYVVVLIFFQ